MWKAVVDGRRLHFRLAGINNQNFIMRDDETGTWWQQISGEAIRGPLAGSRLEMAPWDEVTLAVWRADHPDTRVLEPVEADSKRYASAEWESKIAGYPTPEPADPNDPLGPRDLIVGVQAAGASRAYPWTAIQQQALILDTVGSASIAIVMHPDGRSLRCFQRRLDGDPLELFATPGPVPPLLVEGATGSAWDFSGKPVSGPLADRPLERIPCLKDYWFDWKKYHPGTTVWAPEKQAT